MNIIRTNNLQKSFGRTKALQGLNLTVEQGQTYGFIGPNGSGKSTTIRVLLGLLNPDGGTAQVFGKNPVQDAVEIHRRLAYIPGEVALWPNLTGGEVLDFLGRLSGGADQKRQAELVERFQLDLRKKCRSYSKGNRQKVALVAAFSAKVELLILDEPTSGLDPLMELIFQNCLREATKNGQTVLLSSHILSEVEAVCDTLGIIRQGVLVESGKLSDLKAIPGTTLEQIFLKHYGEDLAKAGEQRD